MVQGCHIGAAPVAFRIHKGGIGVNGQRNRHGRSALGDGDGSLTLGVAGAQDAIFINGAQSGIHAPDKVSGSGLQLHMVVHHRHRQLGGAARNHGQGGDSGVAPLNGHTVGAVDNQDVYRGAHAAGGGGNGHGAALGGGNESVALNDAAAGGKGHRLAAHGEVGTVYYISGEFHGMSGQHHRCAGGEVNMVGNVGGHAGGNQQQMVAYFPLGAITGGIDELRNRAVGSGRHHSGGAAAVQTDGGNAAQFRHSLSQYIHRGAHAVPALAAVYSVENHLTVGLEADGGAGSVAGGETSLDGGTVVDQQIHGANGFGDAHPFGVGGKADGKGFAGHHGAQRSEPLGIAGKGGGQDHLVFTNGQGGGILHHLIHPQQHLAADGSGAGENGGQDTDTGGGGAGGVVGAEVIGQHGDTAVFHPGLVDGRQGQRLSAGGGGDLKIRAAHHSGTVSAEAHSIVVGGTGEDLTAGYQQAQRVAGGCIIKVAVDGAYHPVAHGLIGLGGGRGGDAVTYGCTVGGHGPHLLAGGICHVILVAQLRVVSTPVDVVAEGDALVEDGVLKPDLIAVGRRGGLGGDGGQGQDQGQRQDQGNGSLH